MKHHLLAPCAGLMIVAACGTPSEVRTVATHVETRSSRLLVESAAQAKSFREARKAADERAEKLRLQFRETGRINLEEVRDIEDRAVGEPAARVQLKRLERYRSDDEKLRLAPFELIHDSTPIEKSAKLNTVDLKGLTKVVQAAGRLKKKERFTLAEFLVYTDAVNNELRTLDEEREKLAANESKID